MRARAVLVVLAVLAVLLASPGSASARDLSTEDTLYMVAVSHLDTQWEWTIQQTIREYLPRTFTETFDRLDRFPEIRFGWEGAFRYALLEEYYPDLFDRLLGYVAEGRWVPAGSAIDAGDTNVPSPESLFRHFLYGTRYFREKLGRESVDVFLPDCFGFGWALPSVAAHCGLRGFSTQKLGWGAIVDPPFEIGVWEGPDGASLVAALNPGSYVNDITTDLSHDAAWAETIARQATVSGVRAAYGYFGVGDRGGAANVESFAQLAASVAGDGPVRVVAAAPDELFRDLTPAQTATLPRYRGELLLTRHGTGSYTAQGAMKRWNRKNELLADAAERISVAADWLGALPYPRERLRTAWIRFLWHQFHDDLTGTSIPEVYTFSWNDEAIAANELAWILTDAVGAVAQGLDTDTAGVPLVVYNPLARARVDVVAATVRFAGSPPAHVRVHHVPDGAEVPAQVLRSDGEAAEILFLAELAPLALDVFEVRPASVPPGTSGAPSASATGLENARYRVTLDDNGDIAQILDKTSGRALLAAPSRVAVFDDYSQTWPAWEIFWEYLRDGPREHLAGPAEVRVVEEGPVRVAVEVTRTLPGTDRPTRFTQTIRLVAGEGGAADRVEVVVDTDWRTQNALVKATFPLTAANAEATYDLGLGAITRGNDTARRFEVPAQQWADLTDRDPARGGVAILSDCKYGWDKPDDGTLRLTLLHIPVGFRNFQYTMDLGRHTMTYALYAHDGDWRTGVAAQAEALNQPPLAFQSRRHTGTPRWQGRPLVAADVPGVAVRAVKKAEDGDAVIVRVQETEGRAHESVRLELAGGECRLDAAEEVTGLEDAHGPVSVSGCAVQFDARAFEPRTFALTLAPADPLPAAASRAVTLPLDTDVASRNEAPSDGSFDDAGHALAAERLPPYVEAGAARFELGPTTPGAPNAVTCRGQSVPIAPEAGERLALLAAATEDVDATFRVGDVAHALSVQSFEGHVGQWDSRVVDGQVVGDPAQFLPGFVKSDRIAWVGTHRHGPEGDEPYVLSYLFRYDLPVREGADVLVLPDDPRVKVLAVALVRDPGAEVLPATPLYDGMDLRALSAEAVLDELPAPAPVEARDVAGDADGAAEDAASDDAPGGCGRGCAAGGGRSAPGLLGLLLAAALPFARGALVRRRRPR